MATQSHVSRSPLPERLPMGTRAGSGRYRCVSCHTYVVVLRDPDDQLPPCENCGANQHVQYVPDDEEARNS